MSEQYAQEVTMTTESTYAQTTLVKVGFTCTSTDYTEAIGVWQWITTSNDESQAARTNKFLCRFGALADNSPSCPFGACRDSACSVCDTW